MRLRVVLMLLLTQVVGTSVCLSAQDKRTVTEPNFRQTCAVFAAPLSSTPLDGPVIGSTAAEQNQESKNETKILQDKLNACGRGLAVELTLGADNSRNAFLINPINLPLGVSLIIDAGVTVYGSLDPRNYQDPSTPAIECGNYGPVATYKVGKGCLPLITLKGSSGVYGYGVIDAQGDKLLLGGTWANKCTWWGLTIHKNRQNSPGGSDKCGVPPQSSTSSNAGNGQNEQASPQVISAGLSQKQIPACTGSLPQANCNFTLYKFMIRNPPFHTVGLHGKNVTIWGVKVQSPWNIPNTDGFDIDASNVTVYDTTVANGDQQLVFVAAGTPMQDITVDHFHGYTKGGITILGNGISVANLVARNLQFTGDLPSVSGTTVNGMTQEEMQTKYGLNTYAQALPNATNDLEALQITDESQNGSAAGAQISNITFQSACIRDIVKPIRLQFVNNDNPPIVTGLTFQNVHMLAPTSQLLETTLDGTIQGQGTYQVFLAAAQKSDGSYGTNQSTLNNVVFDDFTSGATSLGSVTALGNELTTSTNAYPPALNQLYAYSNEVKEDYQGTHLVLQNNNYDSMTSVKDPSLAYSCTGTMPFVSGELFVSLDPRLNNVAATTLRTIVFAGDTITLNAVVQPVMSPTTLFVPDSYGKQPGLLSIGAPALTNEVLFYEGSDLIGRGSLSANGTLATFAVTGISAGTHTYTARYPADQYYDTLNFGSVTVAVQPH